MLPALIRRYDEAAASGSSSVTNWGTGNPRREFLHVDDMADACLHQDPQKLLDVTKLADAGWTARIGLREGLEPTVAWYREHVEVLRG